MKKGKIKIPFLYMDAKEGRRDWRVCLISKSVWSKLEDKFGFDEYYDQIVRYYTWDDD